MPDLLAQQMEAEEKLRQQGHAGDCPLVCALWPDSDLCQLSRPHYCGKCEEQYEMILDRVAPLRREP